MTKFQRIFQHEASRVPLWVGLLHLTVLWSLVFLWAWVMSGAYQR